MVKIEKKLEEMGLELPEVPMDMEYWARCKKAGKFIFMGTTGAWPLINAGKSNETFGAIGQEISLEKGKDLARMCALSMLSALKNELGDLDKIDKIVKIEVYINGKGNDPNYWNEGPYIEVANAVSGLFIELFGEDGRATRSITPQGNIANIAVELDMVIYLKD